MLFGTPCPPCVPQKQDPSFRQFRFHALASRLHKDVKVGNRVVDVIKISPSDVANWGSCSELGAARHIRTGADSM